MTKLFNYSIVGIVASLALSSIGYGTVKYHQRKAQDSYNSGFLNGKAEGIDATLQEIRFRTEDINGDGLEDFCLLLPPKSAETAKRMVCRIDYNNDCIQDTVVVAVDESGRPELVNEEPGKKGSGICTLRPIPQTIR